MEEKEYKGDGYTIIEDEHCVTLFKPATDAGSALEAARTMILRYRSGDGPKEAGWEESLLSSMFWGIKPEALKSLLTLENRQWRSKKPLLVRKFRHLEPFSNVVDVSVIVK
ncbi:MAG: hypothetical protein PHI83_09055 [Sphaerochaetaceae bacterium]|jgi:hypothetical protein|nr:hypothetical protein [Sphaerochaetaceae bacterium]